MIYVIGDIQGCCDALERLLQVIDFSPSRDHLFALGDLVNRGPDSLGTLRRLRTLAGSATCLLGNHDWHLLATAQGFRSAHRKDTLTPILQAPDSESLLHWVRQQRMALYEHGWLMVHAGVAPQWDLKTTLALANELERQLQQPDLPDFLRVMYSNEPPIWHADLTGHDRLRFALNTLTRVRFMRTDGRLELNHKQAESCPPPDCTPWFDSPHRKTQGIPIAFGHWSTLGLMNRSDLLCLDTGCVWGGKLTAVRLSAHEREIIQVDCHAAQKHGG